MCVMSKSSEKALAGCSRSNQVPAKVGDSRAGAKREREKKVVSLMISLYCHKKHGNFWKSYRGNSSLCVECAELEMRERIKTVMRFSGPRMVFHHPIMALRHVIESKKEKKQRI